MVLIGHIAHFSYESLKEMDLLEFMEVHKECVALHHQLNAIPA